MKTYTKPSDAELKKLLSSMQYQVTQHEGTEPPFQNEYWNNKHAGIYVDVASGEPLFSSLDKYDLGTGWPSFTKPLEPDHIVNHTDFKLFLPRTEVRFEVRQFPFGTCLQRRPGSDRLALLHELRRAALHSGRRFGKGRLWSVSLLIQSGSGKEY